MGFTVEGGLDQGKGGCRGLAMAEVTVTEVLPVRPTGTTLVTACPGRMVLALARPTGRTSMSRLDLGWRGW